MFRNALLFGLTFISPPSIKKWLLRLAGARIDPGAHIGWFSAISARRITLEKHATIKPLTIIQLDGELMMDSYSEISSFTLIYGSSNLHVGSGSYIGPQCLINTDEPVQIGHGSALGARCMVFTHGSFLPYTEGYWVKHAGVIIGDKVWCAAGVFLHPGTEIGFNSFINSMAVVSGEIPPGSIAEGNPAKVIYPMERVQRKMSPQQVDIALERTLTDFAKVSLQRQLQIKSYQVEKRRLDFKWNKRMYTITLIPATGNLSEPFTSTSTQIQIYIVNRENWLAPPGAWVFDVQRLQTRFMSDTIHTALRMFLLRYYGLRFHDLD